VKTLFIAWQDTDSRRWFPIGQLTADGSRYGFSYTEGAREAQRECGFCPLPSFPDFAVVYESDSLFPLFSNRVLSPSRPEYSEFAQWLNMPQNEDDPIMLLARSGGRRTTDTLEVYPRPEPDNEGKYHIHFFVHGLRHLPKERSERVAQLHVGDPLFLAPDSQNLHDPNALTVRTEDSCIVGYCPRYLLPDAFGINSRAHIQLAVERVNPPPAPVQLRLLCSLTARWPQGFQPFSTPSYQPIPAQLAV